MLGANAAWRKATHSQLEIGKPSKLKPLVTWMIKRKRLSQVGDLSSDHDDDVDSNSDVVDAQMEPHNLLGRLTMQLILNKQQLAISIMQEMHHQIPDCVR